MSKRVSCSLLRLLLFGKFHQHNFREVRRKRVTMLPCTEEIEPLGDEELEQKQAKAEAYASEPERFLLFSLELELRAEHGNRLITYDDGTWSCLCDFFILHETCCH